MLGCRLLLLRRPGDGRLAHSPATHARRCCGPARLTLLCTCHLLPVHLLTLQVGSDDDGYAVRLKLKHFLRYCSHPDHAPADDSPL